MRLGDRLKATEPTYLDLLEGRPTCRRRWWRNRLALFLHDRKPDGGLGCHHATVHRLDRCFRGSLVLGPTRVRRQGTGPAVVQQVLAGLVELRHEGMIWSDSSDHGFNPLLSGAVLASNL